MRGFIITSHYDVEDDGARVHLFGRLEDGRSFHARIRADPYFYIRSSDAEEAKKMLEARFEETKMQTIQREPVTKITITDPKEVPLLRKALEDRDIPCYEADIRFTRRYLIDHDIASSIEIEGKVTEGDHADAFFDEPTITPAEHDGSKPTMLSLDIETTSDATRILSIAIKQDDHEEVLVVDAPQFRGKDIEKTTLLENEEEVISVFLQRVRELDPDIITGWHVIDFDLAVIAKRAKHHDIPFTLGRTEEPSRLRIQESFFRDSSMTCEGRIVLDGIQLLKSSFIRLDDYKLNTAAKEFLDDTKLIQEDERFDIIERNYREDPAFFVAYNLKDAVLVPRILDASGVLELTMQQSLLTGMHLDRVSASIASFDALYLRRLREASFVAPTTRPQERDEGLGGFVMSSKPGLYDNVIVLDFKSLYPSIMRTFNIDPVAYAGQSDDMDASDKQKYIIAPNHAVLRNDEAILPKLLQRLWEERDEASKQGNKLARYAIKILMNSMYGVLASPNCRFFNRKLANAITSFGQHFIKLTAKKLGEDGYEVIYGDTDSVFVDIKTDDPSEAKSIGKDIEKKLNAFLDKHIKEEYHRESVMQLEFEKLFVRFFMPTTRGSTTGAKKRYAGLREDDELDVTGLEIVRSDWTELAKEFQEKLLYKMFGSEPVEDFIRDFVEDLKAGKLDDRLVYRKQLRKPLDQYIKTTPPHVKAARLLDRVESNIINYVITEDGPQPVEKQTSSIDYEHYLDKQLRPIARGILEVIDKDFDDILKGSSQTGLGQFS